MPGMAAEFEDLPADYREVMEQAQAQHNIRITPLQALKGGLTGARLFLASITEDGSKTLKHVILKLDRTNPKARASEMELHQQALRLSPPGFAREHIPALPFAPVKHGDAVGIFYAIAGQSLQNYRALGSYEQGRQLEILFAAANRCLLGEWNAGARFQQAVHPQELFPLWLSYRLKAGGNIERFFTDALQIPAGIPGLAIQGKVYPNPLFYAREKDAWRKTRPIDALIGLQHGDMNTGNILLRFAPTGAEIEGFYLIDFSLFKEDMPLLYDNNYLTLSYLIQELERLPFERWVNLVTALAAQDLPDPAEVPAQAAGACAVIRSGRAAFAGWVNAQHPSLADDLWAQYRLAAAAVGLNFCNKPLSELERLAGLVFAAAHLGAALERFGADVPAGVAQVSISRTAGQSAFPTSAQGAALRLNNLPAEPAPIIGRVEEVAAVVKKMTEDGTRLLTLTGPGGTGKTRLAIAAAARLLPDFEHGVHFVSLADVRDPGLVLSTIVLSLGLRSGGGQPLQENLRVYLHNKRLLLVLDNFEQVISAAPVVSTLLSLGKDLKVLVTSRIALNLRGEHEYAVPPMRMPDPNRPADLQAVEQFEAVQLFAQRAQAAQHGFAIHAENAAVIAELCRRLDGLPLAIELAAARVRVLPPQALLARLNARLGERLNLLTGGARDLPARQQTLRQTIEWSHSLLSPPEAVLFARLAVFVGGWTLEAAEAVCNADNDLEDGLGLLEALIRSSLVKPDSSAPSTAEPRFRMLETIREYALDKLTERGEAIKMARLHARYYAAQTEAIGFGIYSAAVERHLEWMDLEHDNLRAALAWSLEPENSLDVALSIIQITNWFWYRRGHLREGREWYRRILNKMSGTAPDPGKAIVLLYSAQLAMWQGDLPSSTRSRNEGLRMAQSLEDESILALAFLTDGVVHLNQGKGPEAVQAMKHALQLFQELGMDYFIPITTVHLANASLAMHDPLGAQAHLEKALPLAEQNGDAWVHAFVLNNLGEVARVRSDYPQAQAYYQKSEALLRSLGDIEDHNRLIHSLGYTALHLGDLDAAGQRFQESLRTFRELGNQRGIAECLAGLARLAFERGYGRRAATLLSAAVALIHKIGADWWPSDQVEYRHSLQAIQSALPSGDFEAAWNAGQQMTLEQAIAYEAGESLD